MIVAGGALVAAACSGNGATGSAQDSPDVGDPAQKFCCNASSDPCCYLSCDPDAAITPACEAQNQCFNNGGVIGPNGQCGPAEPQALPEPEAGSPDAQTSDAGPMDAGPLDDGPVDAGPTDADIPDVHPGFFCCNANPDPCCPIAYCAGGVGPDAAPYVTCEQNRTQCESTNGYYEHQPDGSLGCTPGSTTGH
jgi:hypothetical protein